MPTTRIKPLQFFVPITRVDEAERIVEGVCFANEVVDGEGGIRLRREAMQAATEDYMRFGAVREMHDPHKAAGTATADGCGVDWKDDGTAVLRAKIVDDSAWAKVQEGVYKGFSVGVMPRVMRGKDVTQCTWPETSLVDRPKDPGALITMWRAEEYDPAAEVDVTVEDEAVQRGDGDDGGVKAVTHYSCGPSRYGWDSSCCGHTTRGGAEECLQRKVDNAQSELDSLTAHINKLSARRAELLGEGAITRTEDPAPVPSPDNDVLTRLERLETAHQAAQTALETAQAALTAAQAQIERLERSPMPGQPTPIRFPGALDRTFTANEAAPPDAAAEEARNAYTEALQRAEKAETAQERTEAVIALNAAKQRLALATTRG